MNYEYCEHLDRLLVNLADKNKFTNFGEFTVELGGKTLWIANHPYASFILYPRIGVELRPSRRTIEMLSNKLSRDWVLDI